MKVLRIFSYTLVIIRVMTHYCRSLKRPIRVATKRDRTADSGYMSSREIEMANQRKNQDLANDR